MMRLATGIPICLPPPTLADFSKHIYATPVYHGSLPGAADGSLSASGPPTEEICGVSSELLGLADTSIYH